MSTCIDVAKRAGVSRQTVSRVINNSPNVAEETRNRVLKAIEELSYRPNMLARSLKSAKSCSVGFVICDPLNPFYIKIANSLQNRLNEYNYRLVVLFANEDVREEGNFFNYMYEQQVDIVLFTPSEYSNQIERLIQRHQTPVIQLFRKIYPTINSIKVDDTYGTYLATKELLKSRHKDILLIEPALPFETGRLEGFRQALEEFGVPYRPWMFLTLPTNGQNEATLSAYFSEHKPTAAIPVSKSIEMQLLNMLGENAIQIPNDVSVIFYDDNEVANLIKVTAIDHDIEYITALIVEKLFSNLEHPERSFHSVVKPKLLHRSSVLKL